MPDWAMVKGHPYGIFLPNIYSRSIGNEERHDLSYCVRVAKLERISQVLDNRR
ncbi:hypothetical protein [Xenorhabdus entomophaga]|uniref:hypothetical protein n=1 Tax=Xenorhabdus entomophaga TaxID=3136257 RepID=UPI0030F4507B